jgi:hypothetical protein
MRESKFDDLCKKMTDWINKSGRVYTEMGGEYWGNGIPLMHDEYATLPEKQCHVIDNGYVVKFSPSDSGLRTLCNGDYPDSVSFVFASISGRAVEEIPGLEEKNVGVLRELGFTKENGFYVPEHVSFGIMRILGGLAVNPQGNGWTITEDLSCGGEYVVSEVFPYFFAQFKNRKEFTESYRRHVDKLVELCQTGKMKITTCGHHPTMDLWAAADSMLLTRQKDNIGEIAIGDLNHYILSREDTK